MILKELYNIVQYEEIWKIIGDKINEETADSFTEEKIERLKQCYQECFESMKKVQPKENNDKCILAVLKLTDYNYDDNNKMVETPCYDISCYSAKDNQFWAIDLMDWDDVLGIPVADASINEFGKAECLAYIFYEMTFFGLDTDSISKKRAEITTMLKEAEESEHSEGIPIEEVFAKFGYTDTCTEEEKEQEKIFIQNIVRKNTEIKNKFIEDVQQQISSL